MPIEDRNVSPGTMLVARYKGQDRTCEAVKTEEGLRYRLDDGTEHRSPSSAGRAAMGGIACNGWRFWSVQGEEPVRREAVTKPAKSSKPKNAATKKRGGKKGKGKAVRTAARSDAYGCGACGATFGTQKLAVAHALMHTSN
jgi:hypothetical protein